MITLNAMVKAGLLLKTELAPYRFSLVPELLAGTDTMDSGGQLFTRAEKTT